MITEKIVGKKISITFTRSDSEYEGSVQEKSNSCLIKFRMQLITLTDAKSQTYVHLMKI